MEAVILHRGGTHCLPNEPGELDVKGANVTLGEQDRRCSRCHTRNWHSGIRVLERSRSDEGHLAPGTSSGQTPGGCSGSTGMTARRSEPFVSSCSWRDPLFQDTLKVLWHAGPGRPLQFLPSP